jgi:hypothetical protein
MFHRLLKCPGDSLASAALHKQRSVYIIYNFAGIASPNRLEWPEFVLGCKGFVIFDL